MVSVYRLKGREGVPRLTRGFVEVGEVREVFGRFEEGRIAQGGKEVRRSGKGGGLGDERCGGGDGRGLS